MVLINGVFAGAEIAVISIRRTRLAELVEQGARGARAVQRLREKPERFLATVQVGITVVGASAAAFGGASLARELAPILAEIPFLARSADQVALAIVVVLVSYLSLVLGELVPKSLALRQSEPYALLIGQPLLGLAWIARPIVWVLTASSNLVLRLFGDRTSFTEARLSREELQQLMDEATRTGSLDVDVGRIAARALSFEELRASDMMVPRNRIQAFPAEVEADVLFDAARADAHSRAPVYHPTPEDYVGVVNLRDALAAARGGGRVDLRPVLHPIVFVPEWLTAPEVLRTLQRERSHLALVVDEHGSTLGLVSVEDVVEELVGELLSEREVPEVLLRRLPDGTIEVDGGAPIHEVNRELDVALPEGESFSTIGGLCLHLAGQIPRAGDVLDAAPGLRLRIEDASPRRVRRVRLLMDRGDGENEG